MLDQSLLNQSRAGLSEIEAEYIASSLLRICPPVSPSQTNLEVTKLLNEHPELISVAVVEDNKPIGLITRNIFMEGWPNPSTMIYSTGKAALLSWTKIRWLLTKI